MLNLKIARMRKDLTQRKLAEMLNIKTLTISAYETGKKNPSIPVLCKLADILEVSTDFLLGRIDTEEEALTQKIKDAYSAK